MKVKWENSKTNDCSRQMLNDVILLTRKIRQIIVFDKERYDKLLFWQRKMKQITVFDRERCDKLLFLIEKNIKIDLWRIWLLRKKRQIIVFQLRSFWQTTNDEFEENENVRQLTRWYKRDLSKNWLLLKLFALN